MKFPAALLLAFSFSVSAAPSDEYQIFSMPGPNGKQLAFYVTAEEWERTPEWAFDGKSPAPLPLSDAYPKAYDAIRKRYPKVEDFLLFRFSLNRFVHPNTGNRWYYTFDFLPVERSGHEEIVRRTLTETILMNGTVVEPRVQELKR